MLRPDYAYQTERLSVQEWQFLPDDKSKYHALEIIVKNILTPAVTRNLPSAWRGHYTLERARDWIEERGEEGTILIVVEKSTANPVGFIILFAQNAGRHIQLGYLLAESAWGKGLGTEMIQGFIAWCERNDVEKISAGVAVENKASMGVLEKTGFLREIPAAADEIRWVRKIMPGSSHRVVTNIDVEKREQSTD